MKTSTKWIIGILLAIILLVLVVLPLLLLIWGIVDLVVAGVTVWNIGAIVIGGTAILARIFYGVKKGDV